MILRSLTDSEKQELERFKLAKESNSFQVLLAMAVIDLVPNQIPDRPITIADLKEYCYMIDKDFRGYPILSRIIYYWLAKVYQDNNLPLNKTNMSRIANLTYNFTDTLCNISGGMCGKYQRNMLNVFHEINDELWKEKGKEMYDLPKETYQFIVWCFEYMGVNRQPSIGTQIIDMSMLTNCDIF